MFYNNNKSGKMSPIFEALCSDSQFAEGGIFLTVQKDMLNLKWVQNTNHVNILTNEGHGKPTDSILWNILPQDFDVVYEVVSVTYLRIHQGGGQSWYDFNNPPGFLC